MKQTQGQLSLFDTPEPIQEPETTDETIITAKEAEDAQKRIEKIIKARNRALALIDDAKARYIKEKTRAKSKKAAEEKDALLNSPHFAKLNDYERFEDINEAYGWDVISESERDKLEALWEEREKIRAKTVDGIYKDEVTEALSSAYAHVADLWYKEEDECAELVAAHKEQTKRYKAEADEWLRKQNEAYEKLKEQGTV